MLRYQRILFPVDFSLRCRQMAPMVESVAHQFFSEVVLLHVLDPLPVVCYAPEFNYFAPAEFIEKQRETMARELSEFAEAEFKDVSVTRLLATGDAADCITAQTSRSHIDLIMMPTHGRGVFRRLLLGSVTAKVLNDCSVPVWTMAHCDRFPVPAGHAIRRILCALDTCVENIRVLQAAADLAGEYEAGVHLVHAIPGQEAYYENTIDPGLRQYVVRTAREKINELQHEAGTSWDLCVKLGPVSDAVRKVAADYGADLVIIGRGRGSIGRGRMEDRFESKRDHATAIIRESPCPVLSV
jgi:nucleotide-binding universal stress UspA family protein